MGKKIKKINQKMLDKMELRLAKILDQISWPLDYALNDRETWEGLSLKKRQMLQGFLEWAEGEFAEMRKTMDRHVDTDGQMRPKPTHRRKAQPTQETKASQPEPPRSIADLVFPFPLFSRLLFPPPPPKDEFPQKIDVK